MMTIMSVGGDYLSKGDGDLAKMARDWAGGGWIEEREEEAVVSQETHPKVDHQPKAARTRCQRWWHQQRFHFSSSSFHRVLQALSRNACDINVGSTLVTVGAVEANFSHGVAEESHRLI